MDNLISKRSAHERLIIAKTLLESVLQDMPSGELIRCKDCLMHGVCRFEQGLGLDGYCSQAERRNDETD